MQDDWDRTDFLLLNALQTNARMTSGELAQAVHLSQSPTWRRVKRMEDEGLITGYHAALDRRVLGYGVLVFVQIGIDHQNDAASAAFEPEAMAIPEVVMLHAISGPEDYMLVVVANDLDHYSEVLQKRLHRLPGVRRVHTYFSLRDYKGRVGPLPIPQP